MDAFPTLKTGAITQCPSSRSIEHRTVVLSYVDGTEQRFRSMARPSRRWVVHLAAVSESELYAIEEFYNSRQGRGGTFSFTDPWTGKVHQQCRFESDTLTITIGGHDLGSSTVVIREVQGE
ncbi:MAG TPA: DUF2460 domain-containing protein [Bryobacteraceae bacterium]|nr:DUF2460 domain-containing protein [Bryobacteraceae bacterium]